MKIRDRNFGCRITANVLFGTVPAVIMENEKIRLAITTGRGADVVEFLYKPKDMDFVWLTDTGITSPESTDTSTPSNFLDGYPGGWQTVFPNGGPANTYNGIHFEQHDEVATLPWEMQILEDTPDRIQVKFSIQTRKTPFRVTKTYSLKTGSTACVIEEEIENLSGLEQKTMWGSHFTFGAPFLAADSIIKLNSLATVIPHPAAMFDTGRRLGPLSEFPWPFGVSETGETIDFSRMPPIGTQSEMLYVTGLSTGYYVVETPSNGLAVEVKWDLNLFPYLWYWQEFGSSQGAPWFGKHYNIGLEPFSSFPTNGLNEAVKNGSALTFGPREIKKSEMTYAVKELE